MDIETIILRGLRQAAGQVADPLTDAKAKFRDGNPFPLVALLWPALVITDAEEADFFEGKIGNVLDPCLRVDSWQRDYLSAAADQSVGEIAMKGCTGAGKGGVMAIHANLAFEAYDVCRIHITSRDWKHAKTNLFGELSTWRRAMAHSSGTLLVEGISDTERHYVQILNPGHGSRDAGEAFSGAHAGGGPMGATAVGGETIYFFDESSAVTAEARENAIRNATKMVYASNPRVTIGFFRDLYRPLRGEGTKEQQNENENQTAYCAGPLGKRLCMTIPGDACLNVRESRLKKPVAPPRGITIDGLCYAPGERLSAADYESVKALLPGQIDLAQYQARVDHAKSPMDVDIYALARFPLEDPIRQAILASWLDRHIAAWKPTIEVTAFGLDVARSLSGDNTCLSAGGIAGVRGVHKWKCDSYDESAKNVLRHSHQEYGIDLTEGDVPVCIEMGGGYGAGVLEPLRALGVWVIEFRPAGRPVYYPELYANQRCEWYMLLARRLDPTDNWASYPWALPPHCPMLHEDLSAPLKDPIKGGAAWKLESKVGDKKRGVAGVKDRLGRSPDEGDSVVCLWRAVFERFGLLSRMNETVNLVVSTGPANQPIDRQLNPPEETPVNVDRLPEPKAVDDGDEMVDNLLADLGVNKDKEGVSNDRFSHLFGD